MSDINMWRDELERVALNYARITLTGCYLETFSDRPPTILVCCEQDLGEFERMFLERMKRSVQDLLRQMSAEPLPERKAQP